MSTAAAKFPPFTLTALLLWIVCPPTIANAQQSEIPGYIAADPSAPPVTLANVTALERFWPYHVSLVATSSSQPALSLLPTGVPGVLIRIENDDRALIDFGRDGLHRVPLINTDLVPQAEKIRRGELKKEAPNFTYMIGSRLLNAAADSLAPLSFAAATGKSTYLCIFSPTSGSTLESMVKALGEFPTHPNLMPLVFPMGELSNREIRLRLRTAGRPWSFLHDHLAETYAASLLPNELTAPAVLLLSSEGRILHAASWTPETSEALCKKIRDALVATPH